MTKINIKLNQGSKQGSLNEFLCPSMLVCLLINNSQLECKFCMHRFMSMTIQKSNNKVRKVQVFYLNPWFHSYPQLYMIFPQNKYNLQKFWQKIGLLDCITWIYVAAYVSLIEQQGTFPVETKVNPKSNYISDKLIIFRYTYTNDERFRAIHKVKSEDYMLQILPIQVIVQLVKLRIPAEYQIRIRYAKVSGPAI